MTSGEITWERLLEPGKDWEYFHPPHPRFQMHSGRFDPGTAWWLAELARVSYRPGKPTPGDDGRQHPGRFEIAATVGLEERLFCWVGSVQCSLYVSTPEFPSEQPVAVLVFKGTDTLRQWMSNLDALPVAWEQGGHVHGGFAKAFERIWEEFEPRIAQYELPLFLSGHSLGGALATLAAARLGKTVRALYTFGSPRVGNAAFNERCLAEIPFFRVSNHLDLVCSVPRPVTVAERFNFVHAGELVCFDENGDPVDSVREIPEPSFRLSLKDAFTSRKPPRSLADHAMVLYVDRLRRLLASGPPGKFT